MILDCVKDENNGMSNCSVIESFMYNNKLIEPFQFIVMVLITCILSFENDQKMYLITYYNRK